MIYLLASCILHLLLNHYIIIIIHTHTCRASWSASYIMQYYYNHILSPHRGWSNYLLLHNFVSCYATFGCLLQSGLYPHTHGHAYTRTCIYTCMHTYTHIPTPTYTHAQSYSHILTHPNTHSCTQTYTHTPTRTHILN